MHSSMLLVVGAPDVVERALRQVFALFGFDVKAMDFNRNAAPSAIKAFNTAMCPVPVIAGSVCAWESLRSVNLWSRTMPFVQWKGRFAWGKAGKTPDDVSERLLATGGHPKQEKFKAIVFPALKLPVDLPYNEVVSGGVGLSNLVPCVLEEHPPATSRELVMWQHHLSLATLRLFKEDYHSCKPAMPGPDGHREGDLHGALRLLHGAALGGWIRPDEWLEASNKVLKSASCQAWTKNSAFYGQIDKWLIPERAELKEFGTLLVVDDEQFWPECLRPMWEPSGIHVEHAIPDEKRPKIQLPDTLADQPPRVICLDLKIGDARFQGVRILRQLKERYPGVPIIVLSVQDQLSLAHLLKRQGVFANISKQNSAEERGCRDELSAFWQMRDAIVLALFASSRIEFAALFNDLMLSQEARDGKDGESGESLTDYVEQALDAFAHECWSIYAGIWEDSGHSRGLSCRQIIRALGVVNDKWCEAWTRCRFDPDKTGAAWSTGENPANPHRTYHHITTQLRNAASHATVQDEHFQWNHVWIMMLTLFLKMEGLSRRLVSSDQRRPFGRSLDHHLDSCVMPVWSLLHLAGMIADQVVGTTNRAALVNHISTEAVGLRDRLNIWSRDKMRRHPVSGIGEQLAVLPYTVRHLDDGPLLHELLEDEKGLSQRSPAQLRADLLLIKTVNTNLSRLLEGEE